MSRYYPIFKKIYFLILSLFFYFSAATAQNLYDFSNSRLFAEYLFKTQQYNLAAQEFERLLFVAPQNDTLKVSLIASYRKAKNFSRALTRVTEMYHNTAVLPNSLAQEYSRLLLQTNSFTQAKSFLTDNLTIPKNEKSIMLLHAALLSNQWKTASQQFATIDTTFFDSSRLNDYRNIINDGMKIKYKSPALALGLSTIIPGAGKFYTHDWKDGLITLITVGASVWQTYTGFHTRGVNSVYGWVYGTIGFGFYTGNLYGSFKSAKRYNHQANEKVRRKAEEIFNRE